MLATALQSFFSLALVSVLWVLVGFTLAFGTDINGLIGGLNFAGFEGVGQAQMLIFGDHTVFSICGVSDVFAAITPALITGAFAERMKFWSFMLFGGLWLLLYICAICSLGMGTWWLDTRNGCARLCGWYSGAY